MRAVVIKRRDGHNKDDMTGKATYVYAVGRQVGLKLVHQLLTVRHRPTVRYEPGRQTSFAVVSCFWDPMAMWQACRVLLLTGLLLLVLLHLVILLIGFLGFCDNTAIGHVNV